MRTKSKILLTFFLAFFSLLTFAPLVTVKARAEESGLTPGIADSLIQLIAGPEITYENGVITCLGDDGRSAGEVYLISGGCELLDTNGDGVPDTSVNRGATGAVASLVDTFYVAKPASGIVYAQQRFDTFKGNITGEVVAQDEQVDYGPYFPGLGFNLFGAFQNLWAWSRNIAYGLFILVFIGIAFQILMRNKLDGQAPIGITNSIPNAIIALALVSLSYAITGLAIDLITLGTNIVGTVIESAPSADGAERDLIIPNADDFNISVWGAFNTASTQAGQDVTTGISQVAQGIGAKGSVGLLLNGVSSISEGLAGSVLIELVLAFTVFSAALKLFFSLLRKYLVLLFNIVVAPFVFLLGATPGGVNKVILPFIRGILATSATFIVIYAMFAFMIMFMDDATGSIPYIPPLLGFKNPEYGNAAGFPFETVKTLSAFGIFLTAPLIPDYVQKWMNAPDLTEILENITQSTQAGGQRLLQFGAMGWQGIQGLTSTQGKKE